MFAITTRRVLISALISTSVFSGAALASTPDCSQRAYYAENSGNGDASPTPYAIWSILKGCTKSAEKPAPLTKRDVEYMRYSTTTGDGTPVGFTEYHFPTKASPEPKKLTAEERAYLNFASTFGDGTPPSFAEWKSNVSSSQMADKPESPRQQSADVDWEIQGKLVSERTGQTSN